MSAEMDLKLRGLLLAMEEYEGPLDVFYRESATVIRGTLRCTPERAEAILQDLISRKVIEPEMTSRGGPLPEDQNLRNSRWRWIAPDSEEQN